MQKQITKNKFIFQFDGEDLKSMLCGQTLEDSFSNDTTQAEAHVCELCGNCINKNQSARKDESNNDDSNNDIDPIDKKKKKKKDYKKRHQIKIKQQKQQAINTLESIIRDIYALKTNFRKQRVRIEKCLELQRDQVKFTAFINCVFREQVDSIKEQFRKCLKSINKKQVDFSAVPKLYEQFTRIKQASPQIEKIINLFIIKKKNTIHYPHLQSKLDQMTFKFILSEDNESKQKLQHFCQNILATEDCNHERQRYMIKIIEEMMQEINFCDDEEDSCSDYSTSHSSQQYQNDEIQYIRQQNIEPKKSNKKKRRNKAEDLQSSYQSTLSRLQKFTIEQEQRVNCNIQNQWISTLEKQIHRAIIKK